MRRVGGGKAAVSEDPIPEVKPCIFHAKFTQATCEPAPGRGAKLAPPLPEWRKRLGPRVWTSARLYYRQELARPFFEGWDEAADAPRRARSGWRPALTGAGLSPRSRRRAHLSRGSRPGGA